MPWLVSNVQLMAGGGHKLVTQSVGGGHLTGGLVWYTTVRGGQLN